MPTGGWRYIAQRLSGDGLNGEFLDFNVPLQDVNVVDALSGHNSLTGTISPEIGRMVAPDGQPLLDEYGTAIWAENEGEIRGGGIVTHSDFEGPTWTVECTGYTGYLIDLPYTDAWFGVEVDPLDVVRHIWDHVQSKPGGNLGLSVSNLTTPIKLGVDLEQGEFDTESGPLVFEDGAVQLAWYQTHDLSEVVNTLANDTPFDWHESHHWAGETIEHRLDFGYPAIGRRRLDLRFVVGENVMPPPNIERDGGGYASEALVLGAGTGRQQVRGYSSRPTKKLRRVAVVSEPGLRSKKSVNRRAQQEVARHANLEDFTSLVVRDTPHAPIGSVSVGDEIYIQGRTGWITMDLWARVITKTLIPESGSAMSLTVVRSDRLA